MKWLKRSFFIFALVIAFSTTALAGENMRAGVPARIKKLEKRVAELESQLKALEPLLALVEYVSVDKENTIDNLIPPHVFLTGVNFHIRNGAGQTNTNNGKGNLIIGYNEDDEISLPSWWPDWLWISPDGPNDRSGSHNIVVGPEHSFSSFGGLIAGFRNSATGTYSTVSGGGASNASGDISSVSGGGVNLASGVLSSVSAGHWNTAGGVLSSVSGGGNNEASGGDSSISGGASNVASGDDSSVSGGHRNEARRAGSSISGGEMNVITGGASTSISGGQNITCSNNNYGWAAGTIADTCP